MNLEKVEVNVVMFELVFEVVTDGEKLGQLLGICALVEGRKTTTCI